MPLIGFKDRQTAEQIKRKFESEQHASHKNLSSRFPFPMMEGAGFGVPAPMTSSLMTYLVRPDAQIDAAVWDGSQWNAGIGTATIWKRYQDSAEEFSQDLDNSISVNALQPHTDDEGTDVPRRVFNYLPSPIQANQLKLAVQDPWGDLYLIDAASSSTLVVFQLNANLDLGSYALASTCSLVGGTFVSTGDSITVFDPMPGSYGLWKGYTGYFGLAQLCADGRYAIVYMQREPRYLKFTCYGDRDPTSISFTGNVSTYFGHGPQTPQDIDSSSGTDQLTIYDDGFMFPFAAHGGNGLAILNERQQEWQCVMVQQVAIYATASIPSGGSMASSGDVTVENFAVFSPSPFNIAPSDHIGNNVFQATMTTTWKNPYNHRGLGNDILLGMLDLNPSSSTYLKYLVVNVTKHILGVLTDIRIKSGNTEVEAKVRNIALETSESDGTWTDKIALSSC
jgi:hypothetical protein